MSEEVVETQNGKKDLDIAQWEGRRGHARRETFSPGDSCLYREQKRAQFSKERSGKKGNKKEENKRRNGEWLSNVNEG